MMDKKGLLFKNAFFALIAMSMITMAVGIWITEWSQDYSSSVTYDLDDYNKLNDLSGTAGTQKTSINVKTSTSSESFEGTSIRGVFGILNNIYESFDLVFGEDGLLDLTAERFGVPVYVILGLVSLMLFSITFALVAIFFRLPGRSA